MEEIPSLQTNSDRDNYSDENLSVQNMNEQQFYKQQLIHKMDKQSSAILRGEHQQQVNTLSPPSEQHL